MNGAVSDSVSSHSAAQAIAKIEANEVERVELSVCRITDAEVVQLVAALKVSSGAT